MTFALHGGTEIGDFFFSIFSMKHLMKLRQERSDRSAYQISIPWRHQFSGGGISEFDQTALIGGQDGRGAGFRQCLPSFLCVQRKPVIPSKLDQN